MNLKKKQPAAAQDDLDSLSLRRRQEVIEEQEKRKKARIYGAVAIVVAVLVAALLIWDSGIIQRSAPAYKAGDYSFTVTDVDYYFFNEYSTVATYASYYGLDTSVSLKEQEISEGQTWYDYLLDLALNDMNEVAALCQAAQANGYTLSEEGHAAVEEAIDSIQTTAETYGLSEATYLTYCYGRYMTPSAYKKAVTNQQLASEYSSYMTENYEITEDDLNAYYDEHAATLDTFDYNAYGLYLGLTPEYDDDGNALDYDADELAAAQAAAKEKADQLAEVLESGDADEIAASVEELGAGDVNGLSSSSLSYYAFGEWLADSSRTPGEVGVVEQTSTNSAGEEYVSAYYVVRFNSRTLDEYYGVNFYNLLIQADTITSDEDEDTASETQYDWDTALEEIESLRDQWLADGGDADSFLTMAQENTDGSTTSYTNVAKGAQNTEVNEWLFGEEHAEGDYEIIQDSTLHGYRLVYFTGYSELCYWQTIANSAIKSERYSNWLSEAEENQTTSTTFFMDYVSK